MTTTDELAAIYSGAGSAVYFGEAVTVTEHSLQAAFFAHSARAPEALVLAALLHDVGHLLEVVPEDIGDWTHDAGHERIGGRWLAARFPQEVSEPVRLHVPAKRYLCAIDSEYVSRLSSASVQTLKLQSGPMTTAECRAFEAEPYYREAIRVRQWDDQGKIAGLKTPEFRDYLALIDQLATKDADRCSPSSDAPRSR